MRPVDCTRVTFLVVRCSYVSCSPLGTLDEDTQDPPVLLFVICCESLIVSELKVKYKKGF